MSNDRQLAILLESFQSALNAHYRNEVRNGGGKVALRGAEFEYLRAVESMEGGRVVQIALLVGVSVPSSSLMLRKLERLGLVERHLRPNDNRALQLFLTERGRQLLDHDRQIYRAIARRLGERLEARHLHSLEIALTSISESASTGDFATRSLGGG